MAEPSVTTLFGNLLSPDEMRQFTSAQDLAKGKMLTEAPAGRAGLLYAPEAVTAAGRLGRQIAGMDTRTPEEIKAAENQKLFSGIMQKAQSQFPTDRAAQLNYLADELTKAGKLNEANKARAEAQAAQLQQAKIYKEQASGFAQEQAGLLSGAKTVTENETRPLILEKTQAEILAEKALADSRAATTALTKEQLATEIQTRDPKIKRLEAEAAADRALEKERIASEQRTRTLTPLEAMLTQKKIDAEAAGIDLSNEKIALVRSQVTTEQVEQEAARQNITLDKARQNLVEAELDRYIQMTPGEVIKQAANIENLKAGTEKDKAQAKLAQAKLADVGMTDFLREANAAGFTEEEYKALTKERVEARARSGDVSGFGEKVIDTKLGLVTDKIAQAQGADRAMSTSRRILEVTPNLTTGVLSDTRALFQYLGAEVFGIEASKQANFANQLFGVLKNELILEKAGALKGALSDKDLMFLQNAVGGRELTKEVITEIFAELYYQRYADQKVAEYLDTKLGEFTDDDIRKYNVTQDIEGETGARRLFYLEAKQQLAIPTFQ
jgi:hypothetical protein